VGKLRVLVADDHQLMLEAIRITCADVEDIEIVGETQLGSEVLPLVQQTNPDLVLLDIRMPRMDGLTCLELIRERFPEVKVVILSAVEEPNVIQTALERGAHAYVLKHIDPRDLPSALRQASEGTVYQTLGASRKTPDVATKAGLSAKEIEVLRALVKGLSNREIARELWLAEQTVKFHLANIYRKLGVANRTEATRYAFHHCLVESAPYEALPQ
jgi:DNA-binding NarL/FixJ family response regulator